MLSFRFITSFFLSVSINFLFMNSIFMSILECRQSINNILFHINCQFFLSISRHSNCIYSTCTLCQRQSKNNNEQNVKSIKVWWDKFRWKLTFWVNLEFICCVCCQGNENGLENRTRFSAFKCGWLFLSLLCSLDTQFHHCVCQRTSTGMSVLLGTPNLWVLLERHRMWIWNIKSFCFPSFSPCYFVKCIKCVSRYKGSIKIQIRT